MTKLSVVLVLLALSACAAPLPKQPQPVDSTTSACATGEMSYACQVERYNNVAY